MSVTLTKTEGATVLTLTSNGRSDCPLLCQTLGSLCYSPVYSVSQSLKKNFGGRQAALGTIQIMIGLFNLGIGAIILVSHPYYSFLTINWAPIWLGVLFMFFGVMCILAEKFPSPCLVIITGTMNIISAVFAVTAIALYAVDVGWLVEFHERTSVYDDDNDDEGIATTKRNNTALQVLLIGMEIIMIIFATLQLCVAISACVLALKAAHKKETAEKDAVL